MSLGDLIAHDAHRVPESEVIVEEAPGPAIGLPRRINYWKLIRVDPDGFIAWNAQPVATIWQKRDYDEVFGK